MGQGPSDGEEREGGGPVDQVLQGTRGPGLPLSLHLRRRVPFFETINIYYLNFTYFVSSSDLINWSEPVVLSELAAFAKHPIVVSNGRFYFHFQKKSTNVS